MRNITKERRYVNFKLTFIKSMKKIVKKIVISLIVLNLIISTTNIGTLKLLAENGSAIFSYVKINFLDPQTGENIKEAEVEQKVRMEVSLGVASNIDTTSTSIRIDLDNDNFYFESFSPDGNTNGAVYKVSVVDGNNQTKILTAVLNIDQNGKRYITMDNLTQGSTVRISLDGYFKDSTKPKEKISVSVNGDEKANLVVKNVENKVKLENNKTVSKDEISFHKGDLEALKASFPIEYKIGANITMPEAWKDSEKIESLTIDDTLTFPDGIYIENSNFNLYDYIEIGDNTILNISDFTPIISSDGKKVTGIKLNKKIANKNDIEQYLKNGEEIKLKYNNNFIVEKDGVISNTLNTSYESTNYTGAATPVTKNTNVNITEGSKFENSSKKIKNGGIISNTAQGGDGWFNGYLIQGDKITYEVSIKNTGDENGNIQITDIIPDGTSLISAESDYTNHIDINQKVTIGENEKDAVTWNFENVKAGETVTGTITLQIKDDADFKLINNMYINKNFSKVEASSTEVEVKKIKPDLEITKTASSSGGKYSNPSDTVTYTITVKNKGTKDITTSVIDELPEALENITCTDQENAVIENGIIKWDNVTLKAGQTIVYTVTGKVKENTNSSITNVAIVDKDGEFEKKSEVTTEVFDESVAINKTEISKTADKSYVKTDDTVIYKIELKNTGKDYKIEDLTDKKIVTTDVIPDELEYLGNAYYELPNDKKQYTQGIIYDNETKMLTWNLESEIYNIFTNNSIVTLYIPCKVKVQALEDEDITIKNIATSTTLNKTSNESIVKVLKSKGLDIEKYVNEIYENANKDKLIYQNKTESNKDKVDIDFEENYLVNYKVKISNTSNSDIVLNQENGIFHDSATNLNGIDGKTKITISNSKGDTIDVVESNINYDWNAKVYKFDVNLSGYTIKANDYIILTYELKALDAGVSNANNSITNDIIRSDAQELVNKPELNKSVAVVDKNLNWDNATWNNNNLFNYLSNIEFKDNINIVASNIKNKYLLYRVHVEPENDIVDKFTITDMLSDNLEYVTDLTNTYGQNAYGTGPIVAVIRHDRYSYGGTYDYIDNNNKSEVTVNGKKLTAVINLIDNSSVNVEFDVYYLVKVNDVKLDSMISDIENGTNINAMNEINTVTVKSDKKDEKNNPLLDLEDESKININDGVLYPGIGKDYEGFFASGENKVDKDGNVELSNGSANAGANLVWKITVSNDDKDSAKNMRDYTVKDILPDPYCFDTSYLDNTYKGAKYYPSIIMYDKVGNIINSWKNENFILPQGYKDSKELIWNFNGEDYVLKPGYKLEIKFSSKVKEAGSYGAFLNTVQLKPSQDFNKENIKEGVITSENTIENTAFADIYSHMTTSYKEIEYNPDLYDADYEQPKFDTGISKKDKNGILDNYVQGHQGEVVKYTLNVTNESKVNIKDLVLIDRLPYVGDIGVIATYPRDSAFEVKWDKFIKAEIYDNNGNFSRSISNSNIKITFSNDRANTFEYGARDWYGEDDVTNWKDTSDDQTTNVRFMVDYNKDDNTTYLNPGETIKIMFYGRVPEYVENVGEDNIAWNNFAYGYKAYNAKTDTELSDLSIAEPAKVGVWVKNFENNNSGKITVNKTYKADSGNMTAYFVLYKYNEKYNSDDQDSKEYERYSGVIAITVNSGETNSYTFDNLPSDTKYKIYETDKDGNILSADQGDNYIIQGQGSEVELGKNEDKKVDIINTVLPKVQGSIKINKVVEKYTGEVVNEGVYKFVLKDEDGNYIYEKDGKIVKSSEFIKEALIVINAGEEKTINNLDVGKYKLYEVDDSGTNVNLINNIGYKVSFSPSNIIEITRQNQNKEVTVTNTLKRESIDIEISGNKYLKNSKINEREFEFKLTQVDKDKREIKDENGEKIEYTTRNNINGEFTFNFEINDVGEYYYIVSENDEGNSKYIYDTNKYLIKINVTEEAKKLVYVMTILDGGEKLDFYNEYITEKIEISGTKTWEDYENKDNTRPDEITVNLLANGNKIKEEKVKADENGEWKYKFTDLEKYDENNNIIKYEIEEEKVEGYETIINGFDIINKYVKNEDKRDDTNKEDNKNKDNDEEKNNENKEQNIEIKKEEKNEIIENNIKTGDNIYLSFIILTIVIIAQAMINKPKKGKRMKK